MNKADLTLPEIALILIAGTRGMLGAVTSFSRLPAAIQLRTYC